MSNQNGSGPPFKQPQAPYQPFPPVTSDAISGVPQPPDFSKDKQHYSAGYPVHATKTSGLLSRCEPILTPQMLVSRFLMGIPLAFPNGDAYTTESIKDQINIAANEVENLCKITLNREQFTDNVAFDISLYRNFIYLKVEQYPILSVQEVTIVSSDFYKIFKLPPEWITSGQFSKGIVNVVPILGAYSVASASGPSAYGGIPYLLAFSQLQFVPSFWQIVYNTGVSKVEGQYPIIINTLIGTIAAINMLENIQTMYVNTSQSLSRDNISQSSSGPGTRTYQNYIDELKEKKIELVGKIRAQFSTKFLISNI